MNNKKIFWKLSIIDALIILLNITFNISASFLVKITNNPQNSFERFIYEFLISDFRRAMGNFFGSMFFPLWFIFPILLALALTRETSIKDKNISYKILVWIGAALFIVVSVFLIFIAIANHLN